MNKRISCPMCPTGTIKVLNGTSVLNSSNANISENCVYEMIQSDSKSMIWPQRIVYCCVNCGESCPNQESVHLHKCPLVVTTSPETATGNANENETGQDHQTSIAAIEIDQQECQETQFKTAKPNKPDISTHLVQKGDAYWPVDCLCVQCDLRFATIESWKKHKCSRLKHPATRTEKKCRLCGKESSNPLALRQHYNNCHPFMKYHCRICGSQKNVKHLMVSHLKAHTGTKTHHCDLCSKSYDSYPKLWNHKLAVHKDKRFECDFCGKKESSKSKIGDHIRNKHTKERAIECKDCGRRYRSHVVLSMHRKTCSKPGKYTCGMCPKSYRSAEQLEIHLVNTHSKVNPFACAHCAMLFANRRLLQCHMKASHKLLMLPDGIGGPMQAYSLINQKSSNPNTTDMSG